MIRTKVLISCLSFIVLSTIVIGVYAQNKVYRGQVVEIRGRVVDELGQGVSGVTVQLRDGTTVLASTTSGSEGSFTISWNIPASYPLGSKTLTLYVPEQPSIYVEQSLTYVEIEVWDGTSLKLNSLPGRIHRGESISISGTLNMLGSGNPVSGATVVISYGQSRLGSTTTNNNGRFSISFTVPNNWKRGQVIITAEFPGASSIYLDGSEDSGSTALWVKPTIKVESIAPG